MTQQQKIQHLENRSSFSLAKVLCQCLRTREEKNMMEKGIKRLDKELEIDRFLKGQIKLKIALKALFTRTERFLIKNNRKFLLGSTKGGTVSSKQERLKPTTREDDKLEQRFNYLMQ